MNETTHAIQDGHKPLLARYQHVLEWLMAEKARIEQELAHVAAQGQRMQAQLEAILLYSYGIAPGTPYQLDSDAGVITTTTPEPTPTTEPSE